MLVHLSIAHSKRRIHHKVIWRYRINHGNRIVFQNWQQFNNSLFHELSWTPRCKIATLIMKNIKNVWTANFVILNYYLDYLTELVVMIWYLTIRLTRLVPHKSDRCELAVSWRRTKKRFAQKRRARVTSPISIQTPNRHWRSLAEISIGTSIKMKNITKNEEKYRKRVEIWTKYVRQKKKRYKP